MAKPAETVLLIEDNTADAVLFREQAAGSPDSFEIVIARNLAEGRQLVTERQIAALFLDLSLPENGGVETFRQARAAFKDLPIIVLTGAENEQVGLDSLRAGAQDYLIKGKFPTGLIARVARCAIERHRILSELQSARDQLEEEVRTRTAELSRTADALRQEAQQQTQLIEDLTVRAGQLRALAAELTLVQQRERRRMAKLLHDHLQQLLVGANIRVSMLGTSATAPVKRAADEIEKLLVESIDATRALAMELSPPVLHDLGLPAGLEWLAQWMAGKHGLTVKLDIENPIPPLADDVKILLFESVRELLNNIVKHAHTASASVSLRRLGAGDLQITVSDSGLGFDPKERNSRGVTADGFGLFTIQERLDLLGGRMEIQSAPAEGSRFTLVAPAVWEAARSGR